MSLFLTLFAYNFPSEYFSIAFTSIGYDWWRLFHRRGFWRKRRIWSRVQKNEHCPEKLCHQIKVKMRLLNSAASSSVSPSCCLNDSETFQTLWMSMVFMRHQRLCWPLRIGLNIRHIFNTRLASLVPYLASVQEWRKPGVAQCKLVLSSIWLPCTWM